MEGEPVDRETLLMCFPGTTGNEWESTLFCETNGLYCFHIGQQYSDTHTTLSFENCHVKTTSEAISCDVKEKIKHLNVSEGISVWAMNYFSTKAIFPGWYLYWCFPMPWNSILKFSRQFIILRENLDGTLKNWSEISLNLSSRSRKEMGYKWPARTEIVKKAKRIF